MVLSTVRFFFESLNSSCPQTKSTEKTLLYYKIQKRQNQCRPPVLQGSSELFLTSGTLSRTKPIAKLQKQTTSDKQVIENHKLQTTAVRRKAITDRNIKYIAVGNKKIPPYFTILP